MQKHDAVLGHLLLLQKQKLSKLGRGGGWSAWLKQEGVPRATADRLVAEHVAFFGLEDQLPHRGQREALEGNLCQAAHRTSERLDNLLKSPKSKMAFMRVLADCLGFVVEYGDGLETVRLSIPQPQEDTVDTAPAIIEMQPDGSVRPVNHELREEGAGDAVL
ncbi:hypothetical protein [Occallatibacter savannae]|uniref:hypothetical protein n=1 Tax=Occallatibacter savannae TaxID=1002691 RepID=UPI0013A57D60|nr:hypothetical protein [Occallatibacter savannae]